MDSYHFFDIDLVSLNLFSFMMGVVWAFFNQGVFGKRIGHLIFIYFAGLAAWYGLQLYLVKNPIQKVPEPTQIEERLPEVKKEVVGENGVRWTTSSTIPPDWGISEETVDKLLGKLKSNNSQRVQND